MTASEPDVTDPMSRHNLHVTAESDLIDIGPWTSEQLYTAVERADEEEGLIVLDYGREQLYCSTPAAIEYVPPSALGFADGAGLSVAEPRVYNPETDTVGRPRVDELVVSPQFDILIPAFDWAEADDQWEPPELEYQERPSDSPSGAVGG